MQDLSLRQHNTDMLVLGLLPEIQELLLESNTHYSSILIAAYKQPQ